MDWTVEEAEHRLEEIAGKALHEERQRIQTEEGVVVVISQEELERIEGNRKSFKDHLLAFPKVDMEFERDNDASPDLGKPEVIPNPLIDYLKNGPGFEGVDLTRDKSPARDVEW